MLSDERPDTEDDLPPLRQVIKDRQERRESFESFSDIMTLLAIALIVVTVLMGIDASREAFDAAAIQPVLLETQEGGVADVEVPEDTLILTFQVKNFDAILYQSGQKESTFAGSPSALHAFLDGKEKMIRNAEHFFIVTEKIMQGKVPPTKKNDYVVSTLDWFRTKHLTSPVLLFTSP